MQVLSFFFWKGFGYFKEKLYLCSVKPHLVPKHLHYFVTHLIARWGFLYLFGTILGLLVGICLKYKGEKVC